MRVAILISAVLIIAVGVLLFLDPYFLQTATFAFVLGGLNLFLGVITPESGGVTVPPNPQDPVKMSVDKAVIGPTIYIMSFSTTKLVLKKLTSGRVTILVALVLALAGAVLAGLIGAAIGGLTAFSSQEFLTQRKRAVASRGNLLDASGKGDLEFPYGDLEKLQLTRNRLRLFLKNGNIGIVISRKYPEKMKPVLQRIIPSSKLSKPA